MGGKVILVVDEDAECVLLSRSSLEAAGYEVLSASDGEQALELAKAERPALVLLDPAMRRPNAGHEFLRALRAVPELAPTPVIVATSVYTDAPASHVDPSAGYRLAQVMLPKPVDPEELLAEIARLVGRS